LEADDVRLESYAGGAAKKQKKDDGDFCIDSIISSGVNDVGSVKPVQDFRAMLARRDVDYVDKAIEQMKQRITQMVNESVRDQMYPKALECLQALRSGAVQESEWEVFNNYLIEIRGYFERKRKDDFWKLVQQNRISLIHYDECVDSNTSPEQCAQFLEGAPVISSSHSVVAQKRPSKDDEAENLLEQAD